MIDISHIFVLSQEGFVRRQVQAMLSGLRRRRNSGDGAAG